MQGIIAHQGDGYSKKAVRLHNIGTFCFRDRHEEGHAG
jgi:hypothetical protein